MNLHYQLEDKNLPSINVLDANTKQPNQQELALNNQKRGWYATKQSINQHNINTPMVLLISNIFLKCIKNNPIYDFFFKFFFFFFLIFFYRNPIKIELSAICLYAFLFSFDGLSNLIYFITLKLKYMHPESEYFC